ncbi:hypothetical protein [Photobacterium sp. DNB22_13_2]
MEIAIEKVGMSDMPIPGAFVDVESRGDILVDYLNKRSTMLILSLHQLMSQVVVLPLMRKQKRFKLVILLQSK